MVEMEEKRNGLKFETGGWVADNLLSATGTLFSISIYGVSVNLLLFLMFDYHIKSFHAIAICCWIFIFAYMVALAGVIADYFFRSFRVIALLSFVSLLGMIMLTQLKAPSKTPTIPQFGLPLVSIALALLGSEAIMNSYRFMRRDQFDTPLATVPISGYYNYIYKNVFIASMVMLISFVEENIGWRLGFGICCFANGIILFLFLCGKCLYRPRKPMTESSTSSEVLSEQDTEDQLKFYDITLPLLFTDIFLQASGIMFNFLITLQALTMNRHIGPDFKIPASCFGYFSLPTVFLSLAIIDLFMASRCKKLKSSLGIGLTHVLTILTLVASAMIESRRLDHLKNNRSSMSALWLIIPEAVSGLKDGFYIRGHSRMYCRKCPCADGLITAVTMRTILLGIGYYVSAALFALVDLFTHWMPQSHNLNDGRLDYVYWTLAVIGFLNFAFHLILTHSIEFPTFEFDTNDEAA